MRDFFANHRQRLSAQLHGGLTVLSAYTSFQRTSDMAFYFEQEANFWWLSGIEAPDWWLIIDGARHKSWLVSPVIDKTRTTFDGNLSPEQAQAISGVDSIITQDEAMRLLRELAKKHSVVHTLGEQPHAPYLNFILNPAPKKMYDMLERIFSSVQDCRKDLTALRAIKEPEELDRIKKSVNVTVDAFKMIKARLPDLRHEYEVEAEFDYHFRRRGLRGTAYIPVVAAGKNACTLHYSDNNAKLKNRELLLADISFTHQGYAADITRTYAIGEPTVRQIAVHAAVKSVQQQIIQLLQPNLPMEEYQRKVLHIMREALMSLGILKRYDDEETYRKYFPHAIGHGLGVEVHDSLGLPRFFQPGMVVTVEPGIYIPEEGIGVRIEDDIVITKTGRTNLSARLSTDL